MKLDSIAFANLREPPTTREMVEQFNEKFPPFHPMTPNETAKLVTKLIEEESKELCDEIWNWAQTGNISPNLLKEDADTQYVLEFARTRVGYDPDEAFKRVHQSNMSKLGLDGKPIYREDGKVLKGPNYQPPDLSDLVDNSCGLGHGVMCNDYDQSCSGHCKGDLV